MEKILMALALIPKVIELVIAVENIFPVSGAGKDKLALIKEFVMAAYDGALEIWPIIERAVNATVAFCNALGIFKTSKTAA
jgi:hypothetical protein